MSGACRPLVTDHDHHQGHTGGYHDHDQGHTGEYYDHHQGHARGYHDHHRGYTRGYHDHDQGYIGGYLEVLSHSITIGELPKKIETNLSIQPS